jgi:hypothetical protein
VKNSRDKLVTMRKSIKDDILNLIKNTGLNINNWNLANDGNNNFRITDSSRSGYYRFIKTAAGKDV